MKGEKLYDKVHPLELAMLLYAKGQSYDKSVVSWQSFHNYSIYNYKGKNGIAYYDAGKKSKAIKKGKVK